MPKLLNMKNLLILSYSYPPSNAPAAQRPFALAKYVDKNRYKVTVITCSNADSSLGFDTGFDPELPGVNLIQIKSKIGSGAASFRKSTMAKQAKPSLVGRIKGWIFTNLSGWILPDKAIFWYPNVVAYLKATPDLVQQTDLVFSTAPLFTNHLLGMWIKNKRPDIRWVADIRDFHYACNWSEKSGIKALYHRKKELRLIKKADTITLISGAMEKEYAKYYPKYADKMTHVYNGFDPEDFNSIVKDPLAEQGPLTIFYAGSFYKGIRSPIPLLALIDQALTSGLIELDEISVRIAGNFDQELMEEAKNYKSFACIEFLGLLPRTEVLNIMANTHLLWMIVGNKITHYAGVPIKFYEYLASRRTIINFAPDVSEPSSIIDQYLLGVNINTAPFDLQKAGLQFQDLIQRFKDGQLVEPLPENAIQQFDRARQAKSFEAHL